jgi:peptidoglycan/xylan/chitin deacetylase (PgdA/CDA1 family)
MAALQNPATPRTRIRTQSDLRLRETLFGRISAQARRLGWAAMGALARPPAEKEWIQVQFYHWVLQDQVEIFRRQLQSLRDYGDFINLDQAVALLRSGGRIGGRYFCVTFDDGFKNCLTSAVPALVDLEIPATFFVPTGFIGLDLDRDWEQIAPFYERSWSEFDGAFEFLDWTECQQIAKAGFTIGSHTHTHRRLTSLTKEEAETEMRTSKEEIESRLGVPCRHFCCPWGKVNRDFDPDLHPRIAQRLGYDSFLTTEGGPNVIGDSTFYLRRSGCEPDHNPSMLRYALFSPLDGLRAGSKSTQIRETSSEATGGSEAGTISVREPDLVRLRKFPYPFQAAFTVASDIDSSSISRFRAIHALICEKEIIRPGSDEWRTLGADRHFPAFDERAGGLRGLGLGFGDSFFLFGDRTTFGMYRHTGGEGEFPEDQQEGTRCRAFIEERIRSGAIDAFHSFLHHTREQVAPRLKLFYEWCRLEGVSKPTVWINHSLAVAPSGICPGRLQPNRLGRLARLSARSVVGPMFGRQRLPLRYALARYDGDTPGSSYYVNDLLAANGVRHVWLNMDDLRCNEVSLPENILNGRETILQPVTMDDGVRYYRFERCYGKPARFGGESYLKDSADGFDSSRLITEKNLALLCQKTGTCILYTHWTHPRSFPIEPQTVARFALLKRWQDEGKIWVCSSSRLLEWTRRRSFLDIAVKRQGKSLVMELTEVNDPVFGREPVTLADLDGLCFDVLEPMTEVKVVLGGVALSPEQVHHTGNCWWLDVNKKVKE